MPICKFQSISLIFMFLRINRAVVVLNFIIDYKCVDLKKEKFGYTSSHAEFDILLIQQILKKRKFEPKKLELEQIPIKSHFDRNVEICTDNYQLHFKDQNGGNLSMDCKKDKNIYKCRSNLVKNYLPDLDQIEIGYNKFDMVLNVPMYLHEEKKSSLI